MTLTANAVAWAPRAKTRWPATAFKVLAIACVSLIASQTLGGTSVARVVSAGSADGEAPHHRALCLLLRRACLK